MADAFSELFDAHLSELRTEHPELKESLDRVSAQFRALRSEDNGWQKLFGGNQDEYAGVSLDDIKEVSELLREEVAGSALPKRANELRYSYTFGKPFLFPGIDTIKQEERTAKRGRKSILQAFYDNKQSQRTIFSEEAQFTMHAATSTDGCYLFAWDSSVGSGRSIPISQISGVYLNPDYNDDVWGYKREWNHTTPGGKSETRREWILTDNFPAGQPKPKSLGEGALKVDVSQTKTMIDLRVNTQSGWTFGVPDLMAGQIWNKKYLTMIKHGEMVSATLALFAAKVSAKSQAGAEKVGAQVRKKGQTAGAVIATGQDNQVDVFQTAGKVYDFGSLRIFAAFYASSVGVPLTDLTADPSSAGASYGSAAALLPSARRTIEARRALWANFYERVFEVATGKEISVIPESIDELDKYRSSQVKMHAWNSGLFHEDEMREAFAQTADITTKHPSAPTGVLVPNNEKSLPRKDIDTDSHATTGTGQGQSTGDGGATSTTKNDTRTDTISNESFEVSELKAMIVDLISELQSRS